MQDGPEGLIIAGSRFPQVFSGETERYSSPARTACIKQHITFDGFKEEQQASTFDSMYLEVCAHCGLDQAHHESEIQKRYSHLFPVFLTRRESSGPV